MANRTERFTPYEIQKLEAALRKADRRRDLALFICGINTGYRISELLWWDVGDVMHNGEFRPHVTVPGEVMKGTDADARRVVLNKAVCEALAWYFEGRGELADDDPVFVSQRGGRLGRKGAWAAIKRAYKVAKLPADAKGTHSMRKTFGWSIYKAHGIRAAQVALGHAHVTTTERYLGVTQEKVDEIVTDLSFED